MKIIREIKYSEILQRDQEVSFLLKENGEKEQLSEKEIMHLLQQDIDNTKTAIEQFVFHNPNCTIFDINIQYPYMSEEGIIRYLKALEEDIKIRSYRDWKIIPEAPFKYVHITHARYNSLAKYQYTDIEVGTKIKFPHWSTQELLTGSITQILHKDTHSLIYVKDTNKQEHWIDITSVREILK